MKTHAMTMRDMMNRKPAGSFDLSPFADVLGEDTPVIMLNKIGRFRLLQLLRRKFGASFRSVGQAQNILRAFDVKMKLGGHK